MKREIVKKPPAWFTFDNLRQKFEHDALIELGKSLRRRQVHPVVAKSDTKVIDGERRVRAAILEGLETLDTIIIDEPITQSELRLLQAATVFHRDDWTPGEKYAFAYEMVQLHPDWQAKEIAEQLHVDPGLLSKLLTFSRTIPAVRQALNDGLLGIEDGYVLSQVTEAEQAELLQQRLNGSIPSRDAMRQEVRARKKSNGTPVGRFNGPLPSGIQISVVGPITCVSDLKKVGQELAKLADKMVTKEGIEDLKAFESMLKAKNK